MSGRRTTNDGDSGSVSTTSDQVEIASKEASKSGTNNAAAGATNRRTSGRRRSEDGSSPPTNSKRSGAATSGNAVASSRRHRSKDSSDDGTVSSKQSAKSSNATEEVDNSGDDKRGSPSRRSRKERESPSMNKTLQSDPTNHISSAFDGGSGSRFDSGAFAQDGFSGLMDAAFATNFADMPANASSAPEGTAFSSALSFDAAFSPDAVKFESAAFGAADFGVADFGASNLDAGLQAFDQTPTFPSQPETVWDKSPLSDVPEVEPAKVILKRKAIMTKSFQGSPVSNPVNGNIIFAATSTNGGVNLHEVDPNRDYIQVAVVPFLTAELREMLAAKYSTTVMGVDTVWKLAAGLQHVQTKEQIAAIVDLKTMEASLTMRVVVVWERVGSIFQLQYVTTPPAGGDFVCDVSTLQVADGLLFVAGSSPKGACIFICKPAVREAWSANFLTGTGSVSAMSVTPSKPYLVVALADKSVTVWTYKSALIRASTKEKTSKRWLFPLCRLEYMTVLMAEKPAYPGTDDDKSGPVWEGKGEFCIVMFH